jgi:acyl carrier protein
MSTAETLITLCRALFPDASPSLEDSLVDLGMSSMKMMRLTARVYRQFGVIIDVKEALQSTSIGELAQLIERKSRGAAEQPPPAEPMNRHVTANGS